MEYTKEEKLKLFDIHNFSFTFEERIHYLEKQETEAEIMLARLKSIKDLLKSRYNSDDLGEKMYDLGETVDTWGVQEVELLLKSTRNELELLKKHQEYGCEYCA